MTAFRLPLAWTFLSVLLIATAAQAQPAPGDPPARVGRIGEAEGDVAFRGPGESEFAPAAINYPVATGAAFSTGRAARAEVSFGEAVLRIGPDSDLSIVRLADGALDLRLDRGSVALRLHVLPAGERYTVATPHGLATLTAAGSYRIEAGAGEIPSRLVVHEGEARFGDRSFVTVAAGQAIEVHGEAAFFRLVAGDRTPLDQWAEARDQALAAPVSARYVSPATPGYEVLDRSGQWQTVPEYGPVWFPTAIPAGWAPYRHGHWAWVAPWGWTWIDDAPWGFAPFHYGRWAQLQGRWCWVPGPVVRRPIYAPALVAFIGGGGVSIGLSVGSRPAIGWVPLGPREVYYPPYRSSVTYVRNINIVHVDRRVVNNITVNRNDRPDHDRNPGRFANREAATVVPLETMRRADPVRRAALAPSDAARALEQGRETRDLDGVRPEPRRAALPSPRPEPGAAPGRPPGSERPSGLDRPSGPDRPAPPDRQGGFERRDGPDRRARPDREDRPDRQDRPDRRGEDERRAAPARPLAPAPVDTGPAQAPSPVARPAPAREPVRPFAPAPAVTGPAQAPAPSPFVRPAPAREPARPPAQMAPDRTPGRPDADAGRRPPAGEPLRREQDLRTAPPAGIAAPAAPVPPAQPAVRPEVRRAPPPAPAGSPTADPAPQVRSPAARRSEPPPAGAAVSPPQAPRAAPQRPPEAQAPRAAAPRPPEAQAPRRGGRQAEPGETEPAGRGERRGGRRQE